MSHIQSEERYSISETARLLRVHRSTIHRWIADGLIPQPIAEDIAGSRLRYWTEEGFVIVKKYMTEKYGKKPRKNKGKKQRTKEKKKDPERTK